MKRHLLGLLISCTFVSCVSDNVIFLDSDQLNYNTMTIVEVYEDIALKPSKLIVVDSLLVILDNTVEGKLKIYDTSTGQTSSLVNQGRAKGEVLGAFDIDYCHSTGDVALLDITNSNILMCSLDSIDHVDYYPMRYVDLKSTGCSFFMNISCADSSLYCSGCFENERIIQVDMNTSDVRKRVSYSPDTKRNEMNRFVNQAYMGTLHYEPSKNRFVIGCRYADQLEIYDMSDSRVLYVKGPVKFEPEYEIINTRQGHVLSHSEDEHKGYICVTSDENYIYALYSGRTRKDGKSEYGREIRKFTWGGIYVRSYICDYNILSFDIGLDGRIYAINDEGNIFSAIMGI
ncbi:MAG: hypothetical protein IJZ70_04605 [Bacteroidales bacterium]|nr:hypothetical protein [Bacteroidales bacterium]